MTTPKIYFKEKKFYEVEVLFFLDKYDANFCIGCGEVRDNVKTVHLSTSFFQDWVILGQ